MDWKIALRAFRNLCAFIGAIVLFSYFANWAADLKHWWVTLASLVTCLILWLGFYGIECLGGVMSVASRLSSLRAKPAEPVASAIEVPVLPVEPMASAVGVPVLPAAPPVAPSAADPEVRPPHPLPWLYPPQHHNR